MVALQTAPHIASLYANDRILAGRVVWLSSEELDSVGGPLFPIGSLREKVFYFGNYTGFRSTSTHPTKQSYPSVAEQQGNFLGIAKIYDPTTQAACTAFYGYQCRYEYGYTHGTAPTGAGSAPVTNGQPIDQIPASEMSKVALALQSDLPNSQLIGTGATNNFVAPNVKGLNNYSTTHRIDYIASGKDVLTLNRRLRPASEQQSRWLDQHDEQSRPAAL